MSDILGEMLRPEPEVTQTDDAVKQKLRMLSGNGNVDPSVFGLTLEQAKDIYPKFEQQIRLRTDLDTVVDGIMPLQALFNPNIPIQSIETESEPTKIKVRGRLYHTVINAYFRALGEKGVDAYLNTHGRKISVFPKLDAFSTVVAVAKGNFDNIVGPVLGHEAVHAHQTEQESLDLTKLPERMLKAKILRYNDPNPSYSRT
jgi:hypothetical protein